MKEHVLPYIKGLSDVRRFSALAMFLSESDKKGKDWPQLCVQLLVVFKSIYVIKC